MATAALRHPDLLEAPAPPAARPIRHRCLVCGILVPPRRDGRPRRVCCARCAGLLSWHSAARQAQRADRRARQEAVLAAIQVAGICASARTIRHRVGFPVGAILAALRKAKIIDRVGKLYFPAEWAHLGRKDVPA